MMNKHVVYILDNNESDDLNRSHFLVLSQLHFRKKNIRFIYAVELKKNDETSRKSR
jgi:hypothetical protein